MRCALVWCLVLSLVAPAGAETAARAQAPSEFRGHGGPVKAVAVLPGGATLVTGGFDSTIIAWDTQTGTARRVLRFHDSTVNAIAALSAACFASGGEDAKIAVWCGDSLAPQRTLSGHTAPITHLAVSPDGRWLASASFDRTVRLWPLDPDLSGKQQLPESLSGFTSPVAAVAFLPNVHGVITGSYDGTVAVNRWTGASPSQPLRLGVPVNAVARLPGGGFAIAGADGHLRTLTDELAVRDDIDIGSGPLTTLAVSPDGTQIATAGMRTQVTMVDATRAAVAFDILGPGLPVWSLAFSPDGHELYTGGQDRTVRRWDASSGRPTGRDMAPVAAQALPFPDDPGARVFKACAACHGVTPDDTGKAGPSLAGIFGRRIATAPGYAYSPALKTLDIVWSSKTITELFARGPASFTPGSKMPEQTLTDPDDCAALVRWLEKATAVN